jgi:hypothetical protein
MYEHRLSPLLPRKRFLRRLAGHFGAALAVTVLSLFTGVAGYRVYAGFSWIDSLLNASMILGGMGPVDVLTTGPAKLFASAYALFSGIIFLLIAGILTAPVAHRLLHRMHLESDLSRIPRLRRTRQ